MSIDELKKLTGYDPYALSNTGETSKDLGLTKNYLERLRMEGKGPKYVKFGRRVMYRRCDIDEYKASCVVDPCVTPTSRSPHKEKT